MGLHWIAFFGAIKFANISIALVCLSTASIFTSLLDPLVNRGKHETGKSNDGGSQPQSMNNLQLKWARAQEKKSHRMLGRCRRVRDRKINEAG